MEGTFSEFWGTISEFEGTISEFEGTISEFEGTIEVPPKSWTSNHVIIISYAAQIIFL